MLDIRKAYYDWHIFVVYFFCVGGGYGQITVYRLSGMNGLLWPIYIGLATWFRCRITLNITTYNNRLSLVAANDMRRDIFIAFSIASICWNFFFIWSACWCVFNCNMSRGDEARFGLYWGCILIGGLLVHIYFFQWVGSLMWKGWGRIKNMCQPIRAPPCALM